MQLTWRPIPWARHYWISQYGDILSLCRKKSKLLKAYTYKDGYPQVAIASSTHRVHQLVAHTHLPNPCDHKAVNHIDSNKSNNHISNLEWITYSDNMKHYWKRKRESFLHSLF